MATTPRSEYLGFTVDERCRTYRLRVRQPDGASREFTVSIANRAFLANRVRYQDAPEICFLKLERELIAQGDEMRQSLLEVSDEELDEYRRSHTKKPSSHRPHRQIKP